MRGVRGEEGCFNSTTDIQYIFFFLYNLLEKRKKNDFLSLIETLPFTLHTLHLTYKLNIQNQLFLSSRRLSSQFIISILINMPDLKELIKQKRPNLSASSVTTYNSILRSLYKKVFGSPEINPKKFEDTEPILEHLKSLPPNKRKTILSALVIITDDKKYRDLMLDDIKDYNHEISKQEKTETQKENWVEGTEIRTLWETLKKNVEALYKKSSLTSNDLQYIQSFIILSLLGGIFVPPRRSKDLVDWKIKNINKTKDNYLEKNQIHYNSYKTQKFYGEQVVDIPKELKSILTKWIKHNPTDYLLFDTNNNPLTSVKLNQRMNKLFDGKKISTNAFRHTYLTDKYGEQAKVQKQLENDLTEMGSSKAQSQVYIKND